MQKQLQFIKAKLGAIMSLLLMFNQAAAQAQNSANSDKTKWLTANIKNNNSNNNALTKLKALSAKEDCSQQSNSIIVSCPDNPSHPIKLRPFMANRRLPSRHELELALVEQKAKLAEENNARLTGQISTFVVGNENKYLASPKQTNPMISKLDNSNHIFNKQATNKYNFSAMKQAEQQLISIGRQLNQKNQSVSQTAINSDLSPNRISTINGPTANPFLKLPADTPTIKSNNLPSTNISSNNPLPLSDTQATGCTESVVDNSSGPSAFSLPLIKSNTSLSGNASAFGTAGPPPFPLNLLPEASLKQIIKNLAGKNYSHNTPKVAFGSWHSGIPLTNASNNKAANLPYAGFQSHLTSQKINKKNNYHRLSALPAVTVSPTNSSKQRRQSINNQQNNSARNRMLLESQVKVAAYPSYTTQSLKSWNFAQ